MKKQDIIHTVKQAFPIEITRGEDLLDEAIWVISVRFIRSMDPTFPVPDPENLSAEPWFTVIMAVAEMLLQNRTGRLYFTDKSFPFLKG